MEIALWNIHDVRPYGRNSRLNDAAVDAVATSIREFGFRQPIVVDVAGVIIVGHTRWLAAKKLGLTQFPVHSQHRPQAGHAPHVVRHQFLEVVCP